jgi:hypothetical protein
VIAAPLSLRGNNSREKLIAIEESILETVRQRLRR